MTLGKYKQEDQEQIIEFPQLPDKSYLFVCSDIFNSFDRARSALRASQRFEVIVLGKGTGF